MNKKDPWEGFPGKGHLRNPKKTLKKAGATQGEARGDAHIWHFPDGRKLLIHPDGQFEAMED